MDDPDCDLAQLRRTYAQFRYVNRVVSGWRQVYRRHIRPLMATDRTTTLLDIGCGGGDVPRALAGWAVRDGLDLAITAIDPDDRAYRFASAQPVAPNVEFRRATSSDLVRESAQFDIVVSNHLLHHLDAAGLAQLLSDSEQLTRHLMLHNDIARSRLAFAAYAVTSRPFGRRSFIYVDGLRSIRRSYRSEELAAAVEGGWQVSRQFPSRLLLHWEGSGHAAAAGGSAAGLRASRV
jgi:2-polyprenyl-3-methyl-5-hydroxy-6-metoxy-1,4-benzoquinol methylase